MGAPRGAWGASCRPPGAPALPGEHSGVVGQRQVSLSKASLSYHFLALLRCATKYTAPSAPDYFGVSWWSPTLRRSRPAAPATSLVTYPWPGHVAQGACRHLLSALRKACRPLENWLSVSSGWTFFRKRGGHVGTVGVTEVGTFNVPNTFWRSGVEWAMFSQYFR